MENYIHYQFIGKEINDPIFNSFKAISTKKSFNSSSQYFSSYDKGISLYFEDNKLSSIFYYNEGIDHFHKYKKKVINLIDLSMKNVEIVELLGDTPKKNGGKYPITLCYPYLGIDFSFLSSNWNDTDNPITYISLYQRKEDELYCAVCTKKIEDRTITCEHCQIVHYCSSKCKEVHISYHLKHCITHS